VSPDEQTVVFARNHNLYVMDAANFAKAQKNAGDTSIVETKLTTDGEEYYSYARSRQQDQQIQEQQQQQQQQQDQQEQQDQAQQDTGGTADKNARVPAVNVVWSPDSKRFALTARRAQGQGPVGHQRAREPAADARDHRYCDARAKRHRRRRCTSSTSREEAGRVKAIASRTNASIATAPRRSASAESADPRRRPGAGRPGRRAVDRAPGAGGFPRNG
jgi:Tol biopolymer transport system component